MTEHVTAGMPEAFVYVGFRANGLYPQTNTGVNLLGGDELMHTILSGDMRWDDVAGIAPSEAQIDLFLQGANSFHGHYNAPCKLGDKRDIPNHVFVRARVAAIATSWIKSGVPDLTGHYAHAVLPDETPNLSAFGTPYIELQKQKDEAAKILLDSVARGEPRPEALALGGLWAAGAGVLRAKPALAVAKGYRGILSEMYGSDVTLEEWRNYRSHLFTAGDKLRELVSEGTIAALPAIAEETGYAIPVSVAKEFAKRSTSAIKTTAPTRIRRLMHDDFKTPQ